jgi:hypothetical protein
MKKNYRDFVMNGGRNELSKAIDYTGQQFGLLKVSEKTEKRGHGGSVVWKCICKCGKTAEIEASRLKYHKSCGCLSKACASTFGSNQSKHSESSTRLYRIWCKMKSRCNNTKDKRFCDYGGRGIKVCEEWSDSYTAFSEWAKNNGYSDGLSIDRINNNGDYTPQNCRWSTTAEQALNKRSNKVIEHEGKLMTLKEWAKEVDLPYGCLQTRFIRGWSVEEALTTPIQKHRKRVR